MTPGSGYVKLRHAWRQLRWSLSWRGPWGTLRVIAGRAFRNRGKDVTRVHPFDETYGVDTSGLIGGGALASGHASDIYTTAYCGIAPSRFANTIERWRATPGAGKLDAYTFLDAGCGKGRAVMLASQLPFRSVNGVELSNELAAIAQNNVEVWVQREKSVCPICIEQGDAAEVTFPPFPLLLYLFNPFQAPVLRRLLQRLDEAAGEAQGAVDVLYLVPEQEAVFDEFPRFQKLWSEVIPISDEDAAAEPISTPQDRVNVYRR